MLYKCWVLTPSRRAATASSRLVLFMVSVPLSTPATTSDGLALHSSERGVYATLPTAGTRDHVRGASRLARAAGPPRGPTHWHSAACAGTAPPASFTRAAPVATRGNIRPSPWPRSIAVIFCVRLLGCLLYVYISVNFVKNLVYDSIPRFTC